MSEKQDIYSITGMFTVPGFQNFGIFGGWFALRDSEVSALDASLRGMLIDPEGASEIFGTLSPYSLKFDKKYEKREDIIDYVFNKKENGIWFGKYQFKNKHKENITGKSVCKIEKSWENVSMIYPEQFSSEQWAGDLLESMVQDGALKVAEDKSEE